MILQEELYDSVKYYKSKKEGKRVAYVEMGKGEQTLVFLHGMGSNLKAWHKNLTSLQTDYRCIAIDFPGYGYSDRLDGAFSIAKVRDVVIEFVEELKLKNVCLVGHSMGGQIAIASGHERPDLISKLVLAAPAGIEVFSAEEIEMIKMFYTSDLIASYSSNMIEKKYHLNFHEMPTDALFMIDERLALKKDLEKYPSFCEVVAESTKSIVSSNVFHLLKDLRQSVLVIFGNQDKLIPHHIVHPEKKTKQIAEGAFKELSQGELIVYENCGHFLQWEMAERYNIDILNFLK